MYDAVVIGSITLDLFFISENFTRNADRYELAVGGKYVADNFIQKIGGSGANISIGLARQGLNVGFWGIVDKNLIGKYMIEELTKEKVDISLMEEIPDSLSVSAILLSSDGDKTVITHHARQVKRQLKRGVSLYSTPLLSTCLRGELNPTLRNKVPRVQDAGKSRLINYIEEKIKNTRWLVIGNASGNTTEEKASWAKEVKGKGGSIFTTLTSNECKDGIKNIRALLESSDWVILNTHECADLIGESYDHLDLQSRNYDLVFGVKGVIITDGEKGAYAYSNMKRYYQRAISPRKIIDTTGAGDAFASGFLSEYIRGANIEKSLLFASQNSASVIAAIGAHDGLYRID